MRNIEKRVIRNALEDWHFVQRNEQHNCLHSKQNTTLLRQHSINKVMLRRSIEEWKYSKQVSSRKKSLITRINLQVVLTFWQPRKESILDTPRITATRLSENNVSGECNVTFSTQISPVLNERQPSIDRNDGDMMHKKKIAVIKVVFSKWMFILLLDSCIKLKL